MEFTYDIELQPKDIQKLVKLIDYSIKSEMMIQPILLFGKSGVGKTSTGRYIAEKFDLELMEYTLTKKSKTSWIKNAERYCASFGKGGKRKVLLINEANMIELGGQALRELIDLNNRRKENAIIVFTTNETDRLHDSFISRCLSIDYKNAEDLRQRSINLWWNSN